MNLEFSRVNLDERQIRQKQDEDQTKKHHENEDQTMKNQADEDQAKEGG